ncbi:MAG TPA: hypothetical protein VK184_18900 [Nostocaceae cyanobacterium]|nr:hypothetical protein [Nostocaceae cyanobacterium]
MTLWVRNVGCIDTNKINQCVTIHGVAKNAKLGAVVLSCEDTPVYIEGVEMWERDIVDQAIAISGTLRRKKLSPNPIVDANGGYSTGAEGDVYVLENPVLGF